MGNEVKPTEGWKPAATQEEEDARFGKLFETHMGKFLEEDATSTSVPTPQTPKDGKTPVASASAPSSPDITAQVTSALAAQKKEEERDKTLKDLQTEIGLLKAKQPKPRRWFDPFTPFEAR